MLLLDYCTAAFTSLLDSVSYITFYFWNDVYWDRVGNMSACGDAYCYYNYIETSLKMQMSNFWPHDIN